MTLWWQLRATAGLEWSRRCAHPVQLLVPSAFFGSLLLLFLLALGPWPELLRAVAPATVWVCAQVTLLVAVQELFVADLAEGRLERWAAHSHSLLMLVLGSTLVWLGLYALPLWLLSVLASALLGAQIPALPLALGLPTLLLIGGFGAACGSDRGAALQLLLVLPLSLPVLLFGIAATDPLAGLAPLLWLGALLSLSLVLFPPATAVLLRLRLE